MVVCGVVLVVTCAVLLCSCRVVCSVVFVVCLCVRPVFLPTGSKDKTPSLGESLGVLLDSDAVRWLLLGSAFRFMAGELKLPCAPK